MSSVLFGQACGLQASPWYMLVLLLLAMTSLSVSSPILPDKKLDFFGGSYSRASLVSGVFDGVGAFFVFLLGPWLGALSDRRGRMPLVLLLLVLSSLPSFVLAFDISLWFYFAARVVSQFSPLIIAFAYIADVTAGERRVRAFGFVLVAIFFGISLGPALALPFGDTGALRLGGIVSAVNVLFVMFAMPESNVPPPLGVNGEVKPVIRTDTVTKEDMEAPLLDTPELIGAQSAAADLDPPPLVRQRSLNPVTSMKYLLRTKDLTRIGMIVLFASLAEQGIIETALLFFKRKFDFKKKQQGEVLVVLGISAGIINIFGFAPLCRRFGDRAVLTGSIICNAVRMGCYIFAWESWQVFALESVAGASFMSFPAAGHIVTHLTSPQEQGLAQGAIGAVRSLCGGLGPLVFSGAFSFWTSKHAPFQFPQAPFVLAFAFLCVATVLSLKLPNVDKPRLVRSLREPVADEAE